MSKQILAIILAISIESNFEATRAQVSVTINSPDDSTVISQTAATSIAASSTGQCLTFDWTDEYSGTDLGAGNVTGTSSTLSFTPTSSEQGQDVEVEVSATDKNGHSDSDDVELIVPNIKVDSVNIYSDSLTIDVDPDDLPDSDSSAVSFEGDSELTFNSDPLSSGDSQDIDIDWSQFPQTPGSTYNASSLQVKGTWGSSTVMTTYNGENTTFTTFGVFEITKYVTPDDDLWTGSTQNVAFSASGTGSLRSVHTTWITRVRGQEGVGMSDGDIYSVHKTNTGAPVSFYLEATEEGKYVSRLSANHSLAKNQSDTRFAPLDSIHLTTDSGTVFSIDDTGDWTDTNNHFDRFAGVVGPSDPNSSFPSSFVIDVYEL